MYQGRLLDGVFRDVAYLIVRLRAAMQDQILISLTYMYN